MVGSSHTFLIDCLVSLENCYSDPSNITCGVPQGSILGPLLFLIYVNDMPQAVKSNLLLYADNSRLVFHGKDVIEIEKKLNEYFTNICEWFADNRLSIHFGEEGSKTRNQIQKYTNKTTFEGHILRLYN